MNQLVIDDNISFKCFTVRLIFLFFNYVFPKVCFELDSDKKTGFKKWNVYAKRPFGGPLQVLEYLGRYTHKVAITAHRIQAIDDNNKTICFKNRIEKTVPEPRGLSTLTDRFPSL